MDRWTPRAPDHSPPVYGRRQIAEEVEMDFDMLMAGIVVVVAVVGIVALTAALLAWLRRRGL